MATQTVNYGLTKPTWDELVDVSVLNGNADIIDVQMKANQDSATQAVANIAGGYDATATYAVGDFVTYNNKLYVCETAVSTPEAFDDTKWAETTASEHFGEGGGGTLIQPIIYSDTEREVGVWRDGKPLYQKTISLGQQVQLDTSIWHDLPNTGGIFAVAETIVAVEAIDIQSNYIASREIEVANDGPDNLLTAITMRNSNDYITHITFLYTKTTDTAGSGTWTPQGVPAIHYSTDEQIVGTWIDGSAIYQKSFELLSQAVLSANSWTTISDVIISSGDKCVKCEIFLGNDGSQWVAFGRFNSGTLQIFSTIPLSVDIITIQYTKSS